MKLKRAIVLFLCVALCCCFVACGNKDTGDDFDPDAIYTVTFDVGEDARAAGVTVSKPTQDMMGGTTFTNVPLPSEYPGYDFVGWFSGNVQLTTSTVIKSNMTFVARWRSKTEADLEAQAYEEAIPTWSKPGHLYIHYKRGDHVAGEEGTVNTGAAPAYNTAIVSQAYSDWGMWFWPKTDPNGRLFNAMKIDASGAVYDVDLTATYNDCGWNGQANGGKGMSLNKKLDYSEYVAGDSFGMLLHTISSRSSGKNWVSEVGDVYVSLSEAVRGSGEGAYYHWFVVQGKLKNGSPTFTSETTKSPYDGIEKGSAVTRTSGKGYINSSAASKYPQVTTRVENWDEDSVGYQIFIASFCDSDGDGMGDIPGIISKLDYLDSLNVDVLWLTPFQSSKNYHGYDIDDYYSVDSRFGTIADYRKLVYSAHQRGMKVVMDFVLNHTSKSNPWFEKSQQLVKETDADGNEIDYRQFYNWINEETYNSKQLSDEQRQQWFGDAYGYYYYSSFSSDMPELNYDYQPVRDAILDVCYYWMSFGLDGFRLDAVKHIYMTNEITPSGRTPTNNKVEDGLYSHDVGRNLNFYREFNYRLKKAYPSAFVVGENLDGNPDNVAQYYQGIDSQFNFNLYYDVSRAIAQSTVIKKNGEDTAPSWIYGALTQYSYDTAAFSSVYSNYIDGQFTSNHDLPRARDRMNIKETVGDDDRYAAFYTNGTVDGKAVTEGDYKHSAGTLDTVAAQKSDTLLRMYYTFQMTIPGICWIYYGDEIGMSGIMQYTLDTGSTDSLTSSAHEDRIYRQPMKWNAHNNASYNIGHGDLKCELVGLNVDYVQSVAEQQEDGGSLLSWVNMLTAIRRQYGLGKSTVTRSGSANKMEYTVTGTKGSIKVYIYAAENLPNATPLSAQVNGKTVQAKYTGTINGSSYGVLITAA